MVQEMPQYGANLNSTLGLSALSSGKVFYLHLL